MQDFEGTAHNENRLPTRTQTCPSLADHNIPIEAVEYTGRTVTQSAFSVVENCLS